ncbi:MAG: LysE family translocator [Gammaproteobacteria bacterium]|jgi:threonine/homoserine/homoserine lactone efflux protein|nr:LysE family translocator [Gammaproteobacteria bacterium]MDP6652099.1 LysE family translocator [Gammaproteobacteria bacterium]
MELMQILTFLLVASAFVLMPGPNVLVCLHQPGSRKGTGLQTVLGTSLAMVVQLFVAGMGTRGFLLLVAEGLVWLKWIGVVYLTYLGVTSFNNFFRNKKPDEQTATGSFQRGFWVSLTNPKTILFFSTFLPQFISDAKPYAFQIATLSLIFWLIALLIDSSYALLAARIKNAFNKHDLNRIQNGVSGTFYLAASGILANNNRI